jgi:hypothetical protein
MGTGSASRAPGLVGGRRGVAGGAPDRHDRAIAGARAAGRARREEAAMLFMVIETFRPGQAAAVYRRFRDHGRMAPEGLRYVASWTDLDYRRCFQVMEADDEAPFAAWTAGWADLIDFEIVPVRASADAAAAIADRL